MVAGGIEAEDSVGVGVAVRAESGEKGALGAGWGALAAGQRAIGVDNLIESDCADALSVDEGPVVGSDAGGAGAGGVAGEAERGAGRADGRA